MKKIFFLFSFLFFLGISSLSAQRWTQVGSDINGEAAYDQSGSAISLSDDGKRVAIGAPNNDNGGHVGLDDGHVRVYEESGSGWIQVGSDINGDPAKGFFGSSVSLSANGKRLAIGSGSTRTPVRVYEEIGGTWTQLGATLMGDRNLTVSDSPLPCPTMASAWRLALPGILTAYFPPVMCKCMQKAGASGRNWATT